MWKWVLGLCVTMYLVLLTFGEPTPEELAAREARDLQEVARAETVALVTRSSTTATPEAAAEPVAEAAPEPAPGPASEIESPVLVSAQPATGATADPSPVVTATLSSVVAEPEPEPTQPTEQTAASVAPSTEIWRVTAQAVNLRAGPSTDNAVVGRATFNDSAEIIEMLPTGWAKVYILESGTEAFMASRFLAAPE